MGREEFEDAVEAVLAESGELPLPSRVGKKTGACGEMAERVVGVVAKVLADGDDIWECGVGFEACFESGIEEVDGSDDWLSECGLTGVWALRELLRPASFFDWVGGEKLVQDEAFDFVRSGVREVVGGEVRAWEGGVIAGDGFEAWVFVLEERVGVGVAVEEVDVGVEDAQGVAPAAGVYW